MLSYLRNHSLISKQQHGFLSKMSTTTNLLESLNDWSVSFENGTNQTIAYIDFAKAFDSVCHSKVVTKLRHYGISGDLLEWITDFCQVVLSSDIVYQMWGTFQVELFKAAA